MGGIAAGICGIHQCPAGNCFSIHYPEAHRPVSKCSVCQVKIINPDTPSISVVEWSPGVGGGNALRALLCTDPNCLVIWAVRWKRGEE